MIFSCIADKDSSLGFRLAGIETKEVSERHEAKNALETAVSDKRVGIIIVTGKAASMMRKELDALSFKQELPLVLELNSKGEAKKGKSAGEFMKFAAGMKM